MYIESTYIYIQIFIGDYKIILDENIPFKKLGYPSLVAFLSTVPGIRTNERGGEHYIEALPTQESAHISKLISRQKTTTKKNKKLVYMVIHFNFCQMDI